MKDTIISVLDMYKDGQIGPEDAEKLIAALWDGGEEASLPWDNDNKLRVVAYRGRRLVKRGEAGDKLFEMKLDTEVFSGNLECWGSASICADVIGKVTAGGDVTVEGDVLSDVTAGDVTVEGDINGFVTASGDVNIEGDNYAVIQNAAAVTVEGDNYADLAGASGTKKARDPYAQAEEAAGEGPAVDVNVDVDIDPGLQDKNMVIDMAELGNFVNRTVKSTEEVVRMGLEKARIAFDRGRKAWEKPAPKANGRDGNLVLAVEPAGGLEVVVRKNGEEVAVSEAEPIRLELSGAVPGISTTLSVNVDGDVYGAVNAGGQVRCGDVYGNANAGGQVSCGDVSGNAGAGGVVNCGDVGGNVSAGGQMSCGDVGGDAGAGGDVQCGDVGGDVKAEKGSVNCGDVGSDVGAGGDVQCGDVGGDVSASGQVSCGDVGGDVTASGDVTCGDVSGSLNR